MSTYKTTHAKNLASNAVAIGKPSAKATHAKRKQTVKISVKPTIKTKTDRVLSQLQRVKGGSIKQLMTATGWQAHSLRSVISGLRKRGVSIVKSKAKSGTTIYRAERS